MKVDVSVPGDLSQLNGVLVTVNSIIGGYVTWNV